MSKDKVKTVLIIDGGGRAHVLAEKYAQSKFVRQVLVVPGNDLISTLKTKKISIFKNIKTTDIKEILDLAKSQKPDLIDVAQDDAIAAGLTDILRKLNFEVLGPSKKAGKLEWDKGWSRSFMKKNNLPIPSFKTFNSELEGIKFIKKQRNSKWFIKASGLAAGKGAIYAKNNQEALNLIPKMKEFGKAGKRFLIEEFLDGEEFSAFVIVSGKDFKMLGYAQDHKRLLDNDQGPNTGGMGCSSPPMIVTKKVQIETEEIFRKTVSGLSKLKIDYTGVLYLGAIVDQSKRIKIIEFNARWGDPEAQVIIPSIKNDFYELAMSATKKQLKNVVIKKNHENRIAITVSSSGYPGNYKQSVGKKINGFKSVLINKKINVYGASVRREKDEFYIDGGRLFYVVAKGKNVHTARKIAYNAISMLSKKNRFLHFRTDIGWRDLERFRNK